MITASNARTAAEIARQTQLSRDIARGQVDISTLKRIQVASDDPNASARIAEVRRTQANEAQYAANVEDGASTATRVDAMLQSTASAVDRARDLLIRIKSGTDNADARNAIAAELTGIAEDLQDAAIATDARGRSLFPEGNPIRFPIADGVTVTATLSRQEAFGDIADLLRRAAEAAKGGDTAAAQTTLDKLQTAGSSLATARAAQGARAARLDSAREALIDTGVDLSEERGALEGTDLPATVAAIQSKLLTLNVAQSVFAKINSRTLFDLL